MLIILSPAKTMDMSPFSPAVKGSVPVFEKDAEFLAKKMRNYSKAELRVLLRISEKLAEINYDRYQNFDLPGTPRKQALLAYDGAVFKAMDRSVFTPGDFTYAQDRIRMISTLYGLVRPLDEIKAYRIAFYLQLQGVAGNLYDYWLPKLTQPLVQDVQSAGGILVNLASQDVLGALDMESLKSKVRIISPEFKEYQNGKYEVIRAHAKIARGEMAGFIIRNRIESPDELTSFTSHGFKYDAALSTSGSMVFAKK